MSTTLPYEQIGFITEAKVYHKCPTDSGVELAIAGRSNVGKSSLINAITRNKKMAITSRLPGRTRGMVFFGFYNKDIRIVDLPGWGFARTSADTQMQWFSEVNTYIINRRSLAGLLLLIDCRREAKQTEIAMVDWCRSSDLPVTICMTKIDKLSKNQMYKSRANIARQLAIENNDILPCSTRYLESIQAVRNRIGVLLNCES